MLATVNVVGRQFISRRPMLMSLLLLLLNW